MHVIILQCLLLIVSFSITFAKVPIAMASTVSTLVDNSKFHKIFIMKLQEDENKTLISFLDKKYNFAVMRKDILLALSKKSNHRSYFIIGELEDDMQLFFMSKDCTATHMFDMRHKRIAIDSLLNPTHKYLKEILTKNKMRYDVNIYSTNIYSAIKMLKEGSVDYIFALGNKKIKKNFGKYICPYPAEFRKVLEFKNTLNCTKKGCSFKYYLIGAEEIGSKVMHNIYTQLKPLWSKNKNLLSSVGNYYIDTTYEQPKIKQPEVKVVSHTIDTFGRTPWMDVAIDEAKLGKGSAENVFPMLDLSYKYIRFSKGNKGITTAPNDSKMGSWCAAYICWTLDKSGFKVHKDGRMASQSFRYFKDKLYKKIHKPIFGAITLYTSKRNPSHGHVGYLFGRTPSGKNILLGGNQNNRLKFSAYPAHGFGSYRFNGFYIPIDYHIKSNDYLTKKDIYKSANSLNIRYGIKKSKNSIKVR